MRYPSVVLSVTISFILIKEELQRFALFPSVEYGTFVKNIGTHRLFYKHTGYFIAKSYQEKRRRPLRTDGMWVSISVNVRLVVVPGRWRMQRGFFNNYQHLYLLEVEQLQF